MEQHVAKASKKSPLAVWTLVIMLLLFSLVGQGKASASDSIITATVTVNPLVVSVFAPSTVLVGRPFTVKASIENRGESKIEQAVATINLPDGLELAKPKAEQTLGVIPPHRRKTAVWPIRATEGSEYVISVSVSGQYDGVAIIEESTAAFTVSEDAPPWWRRFLQWIFG